MGSRLYEQHVGRPGDRNCEFGCRCASADSMAQLIALKARTICVPKRYFVVPKPAPHDHQQFDDFGSVTLCNRIAHADHHHFLRKRVAVILAYSIAVYGTTTIMTSPNSRASVTRPARANAASAGLAQCLNAQSNTGPHQVDNQAADTGVGSMAPINLNNGLR